MERTIPAQVAAASPRTACLTDLARRQLEQHPHFRGRIADLQIEQRGSTLCLSGRLPSFYLKQLAQEALGQLPGVQDIDNEIDVVRADGISSVRQDDPLYSVLRHL